MPPKKSDEPTTTIRRTTSQAINDHVKSKGPSASWISRIDSDAEGHYRFVAYRILDRVPIVYWMGTLEECLTLAETYELLGVKHLGIDDSVP